MCHEGTHYLPRGILEARGTGGVGQIIWEWPADMTQLETGPTPCPQGCSAGRGELSCSCEPGGLSCLLISHVPEVGDEATPPLSLRD